MDRIQDDSKQHLSQTTFESQRLLTQTLLQRSFQVQPRLALATELCPGMGSPAYCDFLASEVTQEVLQEVHGLWSPSFSTTVLAAGRKELGLGAWERRWDPRHTSIP